jgi:hypothetical protein
MPPKLEQVFTIRAFLGKEGTLQLGSVRGGTQRVFIPVTGGHIKGPGIDATVLPGGGDWLLLDTASATAHLDVRAQAQTTEGEIIYAHYPGILKVNDPAVQKFLTWDPSLRTTESKVRKSCSPML